MSERANSFDAIRHAGALGIVLYHALMIAAPTLPPPEFGYVIVGIFFLLSGYLITASWERRRDWRVYLSARVRRILPLAGLVALACTTVFGPLLTADPKYWQSDLPVRYLLSNTLILDPEYRLPGVLDNARIPHVNGSVWTLRYEVLCYVGVLLAGLSGLLGRWTALAAALLIASAYPLAVHLGAPLPLADALHLGQWFAAGAALYLWRERLPWHWGLAIPALLLAGLSVAAGNGSLILLIAYPLVLLARSPLLRLPWRTDLSYGIYLWGMPVQQLVHAQMPSTWWIELLVALPLIVALAWASWTWLERPALHWRLRARPIPASID